MPPDDRLPTPRVRELGLEESAEDDVLVRWQRLDAMLDALDATAALREAVRSLQVIAGASGSGASMADEAVRRIDGILTEEWFAAHPAYSRSEGSSDAG